MNCLGTQTSILEISNKLEFMYNKNNKELFIPRQPKEIEIGNREYKINLDYSDKKKGVLRNILNKKATQMNYRIIEGGGKAIYFIGLTDDGDCVGVDVRKMILSLVYFKKIVELASAEYSKIRMYRGSDGYIATIRVSKIFKNKPFLLEI